MRSLLASVALVAFGCASAAPVYCPDAGYQAPGLLCQDWLSTVRRLCAVDGGCQMPDGGPGCDLAQCPSDLDPNHPAADPFCLGSPGIVYTAICNPVATSDLNQILDAGTCADLLPSAYPQHPACDGQFSDLP